MNKNQKQILYGVGVVVVLAVIFALTRGDGSVSDDVSGSPSPSGSAVGATATAKPGATGTVAAMPKTYSDALKLYSDKRIQFDQYCQANPVSLVFKNPATLMLDNRSGDARTVKIGGVAYTLAGYGWKIVTLSKPASQLPARLDIDCGSAQNVSYVVLQK